MTIDAFKIVFLMGLFLTELIRGPYRIRNKQNRKQGKIEDNRISLLEILMMSLSFIGIWLLPVLLVFLDWLNFADYNLPVWAGWAGAVILLLSLYILWRAHKDLGVNWSPTLEINQRHSLVTGGIYLYIMHPIYAAMWLFVIAQALLLNNWVAGLGGLVTFAPTYFLRVGREEQMMLDHFGEEYRLYKGRTGRIIPGKKIPSH